MLQYTQIVREKEVRKIAKRKSIDIPPEDQLEQMLQNPTQVLFNNPPVPEVNAVPDSITITKVENGFTIVSHFALQNFNITHVAYDLDSLFSIIYSLWGIGEENNKNKKEVERDYANSNKEE